uniref:Uncharacterized protein n=1 Tax=Kalanchoe fedtschenkoi TaxID=63787 RepID=A0A7N0T7E1_KALFE
MSKLIIGTVSVVAILLTLLMLSSATAVGSLRPLENQQAHGCFQTVQPCVARTCFDKCRRLYGPDCKPLCTAHIENQCCCNQLT